MRLRGTQHPDWRWAGLAVGMTATMLAGSGVALAQAVYTYIGTPFTSTSGCLSGATHLTMKLTFTSPLPAEGCTIGTAAWPSKWSVFDGVKAHHGNGSDVGNFYLCRQNGVFNEWNVYVENATKTGKLIYIANTILQYGIDAQTDDNAMNYQCVPTGYASNIDAAGSWTGP